MSYDIDLKIDTGGAEKATVCDVGNMTSNLSPMWKKAIGQPLSSLSGMGCAEAIEILEPAVADISDPTKAAEYEAMNPENGWGDHPAAVRYLTDLLNACKEHPRATIYVSY
jgi:hypothetical protein